LIDVKKRLKKNIKKKDMGCFSLMLLFTLIFWLLVSGDPAYHTTMSEADYGYSGEFTVTGGEG
jgi:hypothetical protein